MVTLTERRGAGFHIVSEANGSRSREQVTIEDAVGVLETGTLLGKVTLTGEYKQLDLAAVDGTEDVAAILFGRIDATDSAVQAAVHVRDCEVLEAELVYPTGITQPQKDAVNAALLALGIVVR